MNANQIHDALVNEYQESAKTVRRFRMYAFAVQAGICTLVYYLRKLHLEHVNLIAAGLFGFFLLSRVRDFNLRRNLDVRMTQITLEGLKLEQRNPRLETFFQQALEEFGIIRVLLLRAMFDVLALFFFGGAAYRLALDFNPALAANVKILYPTIGLLGFFLSDLYYKPLKALLRAKQEAFSS